MASDGEARQVVVVGVDGSPGSIAALSWAGRYGAATGATVQALHIWHYPTAAGLPPGVTPESVTDEVKAGLMKESKTADLIVVGPHGHGGFTGMLTGSVTLHVVNHAACPVVVVRGS